MTYRFVIVGCAAAKQDRELEPGKLRIKRYPAKDLYTSPWFRLNWQYAETFGDEAAILSAEHGLIDAWEKIEPYDATLIPSSDHYIGDDAADELAEDVHWDLVEWIHWEEPPDEIEVLAGKRYLNQLRDRDVFDVKPPVSYPLQEHDFQGNGEQMAWVKEQVEAHEADQAAAGGGPA